MEATREIMWSIPENFKIIMYALFIISLGALTKGLLDKAAFITNGKGIPSLFKKNGLLPKKLQWGQFFKTIFLTGRVPRVKHVGIFHGLIYFGFLILWVATDLVAIHYDTPFKVFTGTTYIIISFLADIAGLMVISGIAIAYYRRYVKRPEYLNSSRPKQELFMYMMLLSLVLAGYLIEGIRIAGTGMPAGEALWSPIGYLIASSFLGMDDTVMAALYKALWFYHMVNTMIFIGSFGFSKFSHVLLLPLQALITPPRQGAVLKPMNFEDENAETFGLGKLSELTMGHNLDLLSCVECGRCSNVCPAKISGRPLDPKKIITKLRDFKNKIIKNQQNDGDIWEENLYSFSELDSCTTCGACMEECPAHIEHVDIIMEAKRYKTLTLGEIPPAAADAANKIKVNGNPWGIAQDDRFNWADGLDIPVIEAGKKVDYLYYVGCAGSYDAANQKVVKDTCALLKKAGVSFAVMGKTEKCNGDPIRRFGDEYTFFEVAIENIAHMNQYDFDKVVTHCPHCLHTIGKEYGKFQDGEFHTIHHTELLADLLKNGKLNPVKEVHKQFTFHDPCYLGRHHGEYNAPRSILNAIPGLSIKEMEKNKDASLCCGMGGGNMWYELEEGTDLATPRLEQIAETKTEELATACSFCLINFNSSKSKVDATEKMPISDVASILAKSIE